MAQYLEFEKPIAELEGKIEELRHLSGSSSLNIADEVARLQHASMQHASMHACVCTCDGRLPSSLPLCCRCSAKPSQAQHAHIGACACLQVGALQ